MCIRDRSKSVALPEEPESHYEEVYGLQSTSEGLRRGIQYIERKLGIAKKRVTADVPPKEEQLDVAKTALVGHLQSLTFISRQHDLIFSRRKKHPAKDQAGDELRASAEAKMAHKLSAATYDKINQLRASRSPFNGRRRAPADIDGMINELTRKRIGLFKKMFISHERPKFGVYFAFLGKAMPKIAEHQQRIAASTRPQSMDEIVERMGSKESELEGSKIGDGSILNTNESSATKQQRRTVSLFNGSKNIRSGLATPATAPAPRRSLSPGGGVSRFSIHSNVKDTSIAQAVDKLNRGWSLTPGGNARRAFHSIQSFLGPNEEKLQADLPKARLIETMKSFYDDPSNPKLDRVLTKFFKDVTDRVPTPKKDKPPMSRIQRAKEQILKMDKLLRAFHKPSAEKTQQIN
eukprot:TRINITY_DN15648_c0_g1_i1.p1 TRINITY_DN15648_c0_g1~~TRINITY_DN15648_c0_g1_i1.p1  ORF type:complete len:406 (-),score=79.99 TRINITY_DN15648_c0_g1_i1:14-1231(-)